MLIGAFGIPVGAAEKVGGLDCTALTADSSGEGWKWVHSTKMLTLTNLKLESEGDGILLPDGASLTVKGVNRIHAAQVGIKLGDTKTVNVFGDGVLEITAGTKGITGAALSLQGKEGSAPAIHVSSAGTGVELSGKLRILHGGIAVDGGFRVGGAYLNAGLVVKANGKTQLSTSPSNDMKVSYQMAAMGAQHTLTLNGAKGMTVTGAGSYVAGEKVKIAAAPTALFQSWSFSKGSAADPSAASTSLVMPSADTVGTAKGYDAVGLTFTPQAGGSITNLSGTYGAGQKLVLEAKPAPGYVFSGWSATSGSFDNAASATTEFTVPPVDATVTAKFTPLASGLTITATQGGSVTPASGEYAPDARIRLKATPLPGYVFTGWSATAGVVVDPLNPETDFIVPFGSAAVVAQFEVKKYVLSVRSTNELGGKVSTAGGQYREGETVTLSVKLTNTKDFIFGGWSASEGSFSSPSSLTTVFTMPAADVTVEAIIASSTNELVVTATEGGSVETGGEIADLANPFRETRLAGSKGTFVAVAAEGYYFTGWTVSAGELTNAASATLSFTMPAQSVILTANFMKASYELSVVSTVGGSVNTSGGRKSLGATVELIATPKEGYRFAGWTVKAADPAMVAGAILAPDSMQTTLIMPACTCEVTANFASIVDGAITTTAPSSQGGDVPSSSQTEGAPSSTGDDAPIEGEEGLPVWVILLVVLLLAGFGVLVVVHTERRRRNGHVSVYKELFAKYNMKSLQKKEAKRLREEEDEEDED